MFSQRVLNDNILKKRYKAAGALYFIGKMKSIAYFGSPGKTGDGPNSSRLNDETDRPVTKQHGYIFFYFII